MKKLLSMAALALLAGSAYAQKPTAGSITLETQLLFQTGTDAIRFFTPNVRARYFLDESTAVGIEFLYASNKNTVTLNEKSDGTGAEGTVMQSNSSFTLSPRIEKHFAGTEKLSPYVAGKIEFTTAGAKEEWDQAAIDGLSGYYIYEKGTTAEVKGSWVSGAPMYSPGTTIGIFAGAGMDYYITNNFYLGAEICWGFESLKGKDTEGTITMDDGSGGTTTSTFKSVGDKSSGFGLSTNGFIRLGWMIK